MANIALNAVQYKMMKNTILTKEQMMNEKRMLRICWQIQF